LASFIDPENYLAVPTVVVTDPEIEARREATRNYYPEIPIEVKAIDHAKGTRGRMQPPGPKEALKLTSIALESAGLTPEHATPVVGHTIFKLFSTSENRATPVLTKTNLDTHVSYRFTLDGHLLVGPGAQVQVSTVPRESLPACCIPHHTETGTSGQNYRG
jgi:hypothetical protein